MQSARRKQNGPAVVLAAVLGVVERKGVPPRARQGYVARVEAFLREMQPVSLHALTPGSRPHARVLSVNGLKGWIKLVFPHC